MFAKIFNEMGKLWKAVKCALRDRRVHASDKLNVNKQLEQTKNSLQVILIVLVKLLLSYAFFFDNEIAAINFVECLVLFLGTQEINMGINQP